MEFYGNRDKGYAIVRLGLLDSQNDTITVI